MFPSSAYRQVCNWKWGSGNFPWGSPGINRKKESCSWSTGRGGNHFLRRDTQLCLGYSCLCAQEWQKVLLGIQTRLMATAAACKASVFSSILSLFWPLSDTPNQKSTQEVSVGAEIWCHLVALFTHARPTYNYSYPLFLCKVQTFIGRKVVNIQWSCSLVI